MGTRSGCRAMVVGVLAVTLLAGCAPSETDAAPVPEPSPTPVFASDDEALAAATEAYERYLKVSDSILLEGGQGSERIREVATRHALAAELASYVEAREQGLRSTGRMVLDSVRLQSFNLTTADGIGVVRIYACVDVSQTAVFDSEGKSLVSPDRPERIAVEVAFDHSPRKPRLLVATEDAWAGDTFCD